MTDNLITVQDVAKLLKVHPRTVYHRVRDGDLKAYRLGRKLWFKPEDVNAYFEKSATSNESNNAIPQNTIA